MALAGPALVAVLVTQLEPNPATLAAHAIGVIAIALITLGVFALATCGEGYALRRMGFGQCSWATPVLAIALTAFFVLVFGPITYWVLARSGSQSFGPGIEAVNQLPTAYLILAIVIVASAEELLYRDYAIARLSDLVGSHLVASIVSVIAFGLAHVPMWGWVLTRRPEQVQQHANRVAAARSSRRRDAKQRQRHVEAKRPGVR